MTHRYRRLAAEIGIHDITPITGGSCRMSRRVRPDRLSPSYGYLGAMLPTWARGAVVFPSP
jgi:hypothetical protein